MQKEKDKRESLARRKRLADRFPEVAEDQTEQISDFVVSFAIAEVEDKEDENKTPSYQKPISRKRKSPQTKKAAKKEALSPIMTDAISALVNLGYKKTDAKKSVEAAFVNQSFSNAEDVIQSVFSK